MTEEELKYYQAAKLLEVLNMNLSRDVFKTDHMHATCGPSPLLIQLGFRGIGKGQVAAIFKCAEETLEYHETMAKAIREILETKSDT